MKKSAPNVNYFWAELVIEELIRNGVDHFFVAPGSRSSPMAMAVAGNPRAQSVVHFDERGLGFMALGHARRVGRAAAVITTSGTAAANLLPAVVEASMDDVPMILLTADRPPELRDSGANQSVDQVKMFGAYARWFFDMPCPDAKMSPRMVLTTIDQAVHRALGPVHINCMFREPLAPVPDGVNLGPLEKSTAQWRRSRKPFTSYAVKPRPTPTLLKSLIARTRRGVVVVGALKNDKETVAVCRFAAGLGWPVLPDILSGLRLRKMPSNFVSFADLALLGMRAPKIETVLHLGGRILSKRMASFVENARPQNYILVSDNPRRLDPAHQVTLRIDASLLSLPALRGHAETTRWRKASALVEIALHRFESKSTALTEPLVARLVSRHIPDDHSLFLGNSMPVRDMNMFAVPGRGRIRVGANRGASGIDGSIATGLGFGSPCTIVLGDLAALHDLNSLALARGRRAVIVVLNNNGGGIFSFLPIAQSAPHFEKMFGTPHGLAFKAAAEQFGLNYFAPKTKSGFVEAYRAACDTSMSTLIEVRTDRADNVAVHRALQAAVTRALSA